MAFFTFDDSKTHAYIDRALQWGADQRNHKDKLLKAFGYLYQKRGQEDPNDDNRELAAAEHYMYARYQVYSGETSSVVMAAITVGYDYMKVLAYNPIIFLTRKFVFRHSWVRPSTDGVRWGLKGCADGAGDRAADGTVR